MARRNKYNPDYKKIYPGVDISPLVLKTLQQSDRKMKYMEVEIKQGIFKQDTADFSPSREDSLERLREEKRIEFPSSERSPEEIAVHNDEIDRLCKALQELKPEEYDLIHALFFEGLTEREYAEKTRTAPMTVHNRKVQIQKKLKNLLEN